MDARSLCIASFAAVTVVLAPGSAAAQVPPAPPPYAQAPYPYAPYAMPMRGYAPPGFGRAPNERRSPEMVAVGAVMIAVGSAAAIAGASVMAAGTTSAFEPLPPCFDGIDCGATSRQSKPGLTAGGAALVAIGTVTLAVGIPVLAVGMQRVPARPEAALVPELRVGASGALLSWRLP